MKKILSLVVCLAMVLSMMVAPAMADAAFTAGTYTASAQGNNGPVTVEVVFSDSAIVSVTVTEHGETAGLSDPAISGIPAAIVDQQSLSVDTVAGATFPSKGILAAVADCVAQAGVDPESLKSASTAEATVAEDEVLECDVVVVGGGAAGIGAAFNAKEAGANVILLEKQAFMGGNTLISGGLIYATGTTFQAEAGVEDSVEALVDYWYTRAEGHANKDMLTMVAEKSAETVQWLQDNGVELTGPTTSGTSLVPRMQDTGKGGSGFILPMSAKIQEMGVDVRLQVAAQSLLTNENGAVCGVEAVAADGHKVTVVAKSVVLASGGYDNDQSMMRKYSPSYADEYMFANPGNTGDGIKMGMAVGADTVFNDGVIGLRGVVPTSFADATNGLVWMPYLMVNQEGERFVNESTDYPIVHTYLSAQSGASYLLFDGTQGVPAMFGDLYEQGYAFYGETLEDVAAAAHLPVATFLATVARYNELKGQEDVDFGKPAYAMTGVGEGPYTALRIMPATIGTIGGLKIDLDGHVLDTNGAPIAGLYAAGAVANGEFFYREYPASGTSIQMCFTTGRIAGTNAAEQK